MKKQRICLMTLFLIDPQLAVYHYSPSPITDDDSSTQVNLWDSHHLIMMQTNNKKIRDFKRNIAVYHYSPSRITDDDSSTQTNLWDSHHLIMMQTNNKKIRDIKRNIGRAKEELIQCIYGRWK
ncbi:hypothetical protein J6590_092320 [Homalodisca vitripennis]|nr:hypothetical protein J6590_092320 [Homalodisca vitripennis]